MALGFHAFTAIVLLTVCLAARGANDTMRSRNDSSTQPVRFVLFSVQESGTHFFRNVFLSQSKVYFWNEICNYGPKSLSSCLDKVSFALGLPILKEMPSPDDIERMASQRDVFKNGEAPKCFGDSSTQIKCFNSYIQRANAVGCILHQNQGWSKKDFLQGFVNIAHSNKEQFNVDIRAVFLHRTNFIAHSIAAPNTNIRAHHVEVVQSEHTIVLEKVYKKYFAFQEKYFTAIKTFRDEKIPIVYVTYERLCRNATTFVSLFQNLNIPITRAVEVSNGTKHHSNHTHVYIRNVHEIMEKLNSTDNRYANSYTKMDVCMLYDDCVLNPPAFCKSIPCFI